jgi:hypothetical protein
MNNQMCNWSLNFSVVQNHYQHLHSHFRLVVTWLRVYDQSDQRKTGKITAKITSNWSLQTKDLMNKLRYYKIPASFQLSENTQFTLSHQAKKTSYLHQ